MEAIDSVCVLRRFKWAGVAGEVVAVSSSSRREIERVNDRRSSACVSATFCFQVSSSRGGKGRTRRGAGLWLAGGCGGGGRMPEQGRQRRTGRWSEKPAGRISDVAALHLHSVFAFARATVSAFPH